MGEVSNSDKEATHWKCFTEWVPTRWRNVLAYFELIQRTLYKVRDGLEHQILTRHLVDMNHYIILKYYNQKLYCSIIKKAYT